MAKKDVIVLDWPKPLGVLEKNGATPADTDSIKDSKGREVNNGWCWEVGKGYLKNAIKAESLTDMVDQVLKSLKPGDCIKSLTFAGHGAAGVISVGAGTNYDKDAEINSNRDKWEPQLKKLCPKFCKDEDTIEILLMGCDTGVCDKGAAKLFELAKFFKDCIAPGKEKPEIKVYGTKRASGADVKKAIQDKKREHLVMVSSDTEKKPACLTKPVKDGVKKKKKPEKKDMKSSSLIPHAADYKAIAFRNNTRDTDLERPVAFLQPQPISIQEFFGLFDFNTAYEPTGLPSKTNGYVYLQNLENECEVHKIILDHRGFVFNSEAGQTLYFLRNENDVGIIEDLLQLSAPC